MLLNRSRIRLTRKKQARSITLATSHLFLRVNNWGKGFTDLKTCSLGLGREIDFRGGCGWIYDGYRRGLGRGRRASVRILGTVFGDGDDGEEEEEEEYGGG